MVPSLITWAPPFLDSTGQSLGVEIMKKLVFAGIALGALVAAGSAQAADLPFKAPPAAVPAPGYDWNGLYIGGHIGGGWATNDISDPGLGFVGTILGIPPVQTVDSSGFLGGVQGGWNYQIGRLVLGTEIDFSWASINGTNTASLTPLIGLLPPGGTLNRSLTANTDWTSTSTVRLGYAHDRWMFYSKVGAAFAHTNYTSNLTASAPGFGSATFFNGTGAGTRVGWTVGFGAEWAFWNNWSAKLEYDFMDFGSKTTTINGAIPLAIPAVPFSAGLVNDQTISEIKFGVNYKIMPLLF
jgi:outer membrane immunogenic protein